MKDTFDFVDTIVILNMYTSSLILLKHTSTLSFSKCAMIIWSFYFTLPVKKLPTEMCFGYTYCIHISANTVQVVGLEKSPTVCAACKTSNNNENEDTVCVEKKTRQKIKSVQTIFPPCVV